MALSAPPSLDTSLSRGAFLGQALPPLQQAAQQVSLRRGHVAGAPVASMSPNPRPHQHADISVAARAASATSSAIGSVTAASLAYRNATAQVQQALQNYPPSLANASSLAQQQQSQQYPRQQQQQQQQEQQVERQDLQQLAQQAASAEGLGLEKVLKVVEGGVQPHPAASAASAEEAFTLPPARPHSDQAIKVIATDVDGTLLDSRQQLSERTELALRLAMDQGVQVVLATGKARGPWVPEIMQRLKLNTPGVFLQGLMVYSADGTVLYERCLENDVALEIVGEAESRDLTVVAYCGERILCSETNSHTDRLIGYGEPVPEAVGSLGDALATTPVHKMLFMADDTTLAVLRRQLEVQLAGRASLVTALHGMLEVIPLGASKAVGLQRVLAMLGVHEAAVLAAGDGENDIEMLQMAGLAVAMGNAGPQVKSEAHYVSTSNDQDGLAHAVERFVLKPGFWCWD